MDEVISKDFSCDPLVALGRNGNGDGNGGNENRMRVVADGKAALAVADDGEYTNAEDMMRRVLRVVDVDICRLCSCGGCSRRENLAEVGGIVSCQWW